MYSLHNKRKLFIDSLISKEVDTILIVSRPDFVLNYFVYWQKNGNGTLNVNGTFIDSFSLIKEIDFFILNLDSIQIESDYGPEVYDDRNTFIELFLNKNRNFIVLGDSIRNRYKNDIKVKWVDMVLKRLNSYLK
jgi:hypothetical protein